MFFRIEGEEAKSVFEGLTELIGIGSKALVQLAKKWDWEAHHLEERATLSDEEVTRELELKKVEYSARMAKAKADIAEAELRFRRADLQKRNLDRQMRAQPPRKNNPNERKGTSLEGNDKGLTFKLGDKDSKPLS